MSQSIIPQSRHASFFLSCGSQKPVAIKEIGLELNVDKTKYMVMSGEQNAGRSQNMRSDNRSFERVEEFKNLGTTLTNQNSIQ